MSRSLSQDAKRVERALGELTGVDLLVLETLAVVFTPVTRTNLVKVLRRVSPRTPDGKAWSTTRLRPCFERLEASGLLLNRGNIACTPHVRDAVVRSLVREGRLDAVVAAVRSGLPVDHPEGARAVFLALVSEDHRGVCAAWDAIIARRPADQPLLELLSAATEPRRAGQSTSPGLDLDRVVPLPSSVLDKLLLEVFDRDRWDRRMEQVMDLAPVLGNHCEGGSASERLRLRYVEELLWRGDPDGAEPALGSSTVPRAHGLRGWLALLRGDPKKAVAAFKGAGTVLEERIFGFLYVLALLGLGTAAARKQAMRFARTEQRAERRPSDESKDLVRLVEVAAGGRLEPWEWRYRARGDLGDLAEAIWMTWAGHALPERLLAGLEALVKESVTWDHAWLAWEAGALLARGRADDARLASVLAAQEESGVVGLVGLVTPVAPWVKQLDAFRAVVLPEAQAPAAPAARAGDSRLVWFMSWSDAGYLHFAPREQRHNARGWTKGRPIALKRLYDDRSAFDYLLPQDLEILRHLKREVSYGGYRNRYLDERYFFDGGRALLAMAGHPNLVWEDEPERGVQLSVGRATLSVEPREGGVFVRMDPSSDKEIAVRRPGPDRLEVVPLDRVHRQVASALGEGMWAPDSVVADVRAAAERLAGHLAIHTGLDGWGARVVPADATVRVHATDDGAALRVRCVVAPLGERGPGLKPGEGAASVVGTSDGDAIQATRDLGAERAAQAQVLASCPTLAEAPPDRGVWRVTDQVARRALVVELAALGDQVVWSGPRPAVSVVGADALRVEIRGGGELALRGEVEVDVDLRVELSGLISMLSATPGRVLALESGRYLALTEELASLLEGVSPWSLGVKRGRLRVHPLGADSLQELADGAGSAVMDAAFSSLVARVRSADALDPQVPPTFKAELRAYQRTGFRWLARLAHWGAGACLADDMGLGKTVQALALLVHRAGEGPSLVVAPTSVVDGWLREARRFAPTLRMVALADTDRSAALEGAAGGTVVVCSYGLLHTEGASLGAVDWATVVLDESQQIKNPRTHRFRAATALSARCRVALTGTPIENRLEELWALFAFLNPGLLCTLPSFKRRWLAPVERDRDPEAARQLRSLVRPFVLRRTKAAVLDELPPRTDVVLRVRATPEEAALYEALRRRALEDLESGSGGSGWRMRAFAHLTRLRLAVCHPRLVQADLPDLPAMPAGSAKLDAFGELVEELVDAGHKALVFSQFVRHLEVVRTWLDERGVSYQYLDGQTPARDRAAAVDAFQRGDGDLFLISLRAGGTGLNLTAADFVVHLDPWWNPAVEDQASDRAHRIGQSRPVTVYRLVVADTIEERIVDLHGRKRDLADAIVGGADVAAAVSADQVIALLRDARSEGAAR